MENPSPIVFEKVIEVQESDLDQMNHVNNVRYVQWIQDIAKSHWDEATDDFQKKTFLWVVLSHHIYYKAPAFLGDKIHIRTYIKKSSGVTSIRVVEMHNSITKQLLVKAETTWCLLLSDTLKPHRVPQELISLFIR
ncbi:acyl-CoA thioesterase [Ascidiimonas sp. W6]|uniref:acyl-CoA thioesterase n=1 Tax=Ascidiimonas meishanensis TaxID=3128903 RepID=UPI0030ED472E